MSEAVFLSLLLAYIQCCSVLGEAMDNGRKSY